MDVHFSGGTTNLIAHLSCHILLLKFMSSAFIKKKKKKKKKSPPPQKKTPHKNPNQQKNTPQNQTKTPQTKQSYINIKLKRYQLYCNTYRSILSSITIAIRF